MIVVKKESDLNRVKISREWNGNEMINGRRRVDHNSQECNSRRKKGEWSES